MIKLKRVAEERYDGADQYRNASLTVSHGEIVGVSEQKAEELLAEGGWEHADPAELQRIAERQAHEEATRDPMAGFRSGTGPKRGSTPKKEG